MQLNLPTLPKLPSEDDWEQVSLDQLRAWDWAAENPALLRQLASIGGNVNQIARDLNSRARAEATVDVEAKFAELRRIEQHLHDHEED